MTKSRDIADSINRIDSSAADATAMTIDANENIGIGSTVPKGKLTIQKDQAGSSTSGTGTTLTFNGNAGSGNPWEIYRDNGITGDLVFCQDASDTRSEAIRIRLAGGGITFNGDTAEANALDDYEIGTWTPGIVGMTFSTAAGIYTKIGRRVHCSGIISTCSSGTASAVAAKLNGLPFTVSDTLSGTALEDGGFFHYWANLGVSASSVMISPDDSSTEAYMYYVPGSGATTLTTAQRTAFDASNFSCRICFTYIST